MARLLLCPWDLLHPCNILVIESNKINHAADYFGSSCELHHGDTTVAAEENYEVWGQFKWGPGGQCPANLIDKTATPQHLRAVLCKLILINDVLTCEPHAGKRSCAFLHISALGGTVGPFACDLAKSFQVTLKCEAGNCWQSVAGRLEG